MAIQYCYTAVLAALIITVTSGNPLREGRRVPPGIRPITLEELEDTCSVQGWTHCLHMVRSLLNATHPINVGYAACLSRNNPYSSSDTSPAPVTYSNAGNSTNNATESGSAELPTTTNTSSSSDEAGEQQRCTVSGEQKKRIRSEVYCKQLFDIDEMLDTLIPYMCLLRDTHCVQYFPDPGYLTPHQIMDSIRLWHESVIDTHKKCCESQNEPTTGRIFTRNLDQLYDTRVDFTIGDLLGTCFIQGGNNNWDLGLKTVALMVHIVELMQDLGRRRTCLRGCFSEGQVQCTNLLL